MFYLTSPSSETKVKPLNKRFQSSSFQTLIFLIGFGAIAHSVIKHLPFSNFLPLHPPPTLRILESRRSLTGHIVIGEISNTPQGDELEVLRNTVRFMRADHSILGGLWIGHSRLGYQDRFGTTPKNDEDVLWTETIYSTFILQEAAILTKPSRDEIIERERALIM
jgi:hypothetical protein